MTRSFYWSYFFFNLLFARNYKGMTNEWKRSLWTISNNHLQLCPQISPDLATRPEKKKKKKGPFCTDSFIRFQSFVTHLYLPCVWERKQQWSKSPQPEDSYDSFFCSTLRAIQSWTAHAPKHRSPRAEDAKQPTPLWIRHSFLSAKLHYNVQEASAWWRDTNNEIQVHNRMRYNTRSCLYKDDVNARFEDCTASHCSEHSDPHLNLEGIQNGTLCQKVHRNNFIVER